MRYQNFRKRHQRLLDAAHLGGWMVAPSSPNPEALWVLSHPDRAGRRPRLAWSLMHGDEPTGFEALCALVAQGPPESDWTLVPIVNPSGCENFQRTTLLGVDLNRRARDPGPWESDELKRIIQSKPYELALNLHDQRSLFHPRGAMLPSSLSLLAPRRRELSGFEWVPEMAQRWAGFIGHYMHELEPTWGIARFDDSYYPNAFGEWCQEQGISTVTVETGVGLDDYPRVTVGQRLGQTIAALDRLETPNSTFEQFYRELPDNCGSGYDVMLASEHGRSWWRVVEAVQQGIFTAGLNRIEGVDESSAIAYRIIALSEQEHRRWMERPYWTARSLYASDSAELRAFAAELPK